MKAEGDREVEEGQPGRAGPAEDSPERKADPEVQLPIQMRPSDQGQQQKGR